MKTTTFIYILEDPRNSIPRYLGKSNNPISRLKSHIKEAEHPTKIKYDHKNNWIRSLLKDGIEPILTIWDEVPLSEWAFWETHYGHLFLSWGFDMVFDRNYLGVGTTVLNKNQIDKSKIRKPMSMEGRLNIKLAAQKRSSNPTQAMLDMYKKFGAREFGIPSCTKGKKMSDETKKKMSESHKGEKAAWFGKKQPEEMREKNRQMHLGKIHTNETKDKMSISQKKRWLIKKKDI